jgi:hypothetical protein
MGLVIVSGEGNEAKFQRDGEGSLIGLLCSQTAHDQNVLGRCAQWETDSGHRVAHLAREGGGLIYKGKRINGQIL